METSIDKNKILILVLCSRNYLSKISSRAQQSIWRPYISKLNIVHFVGDENPTSREVNYISENSKKYLVVNTNDNYANLAKKTLLAFEKIYEDYEFDYIFRTNTSSYINIEKFEKYIKSNPEKLDYSGVTLKAVEGDNIASGAGIFLSRSNIKRLIDSKTQYDFTLPDDVAIARTLRSFKIYPQNINRKDLKDVPTPASVYNSKEFHYRCRLDPQYHRILEPKLMKYLQRASSTKGMGVYLNYLLLKSIFLLSNKIIIKKLIQKYYSFNFYGELQIGNKFLYNKNRNII